MGWVINGTLRPLYRWEGAGTHCVGGWVDLGACGKSPPPGFDPGPSST